MRADRDRDFNSGLLWAILLTLLFWIGFTFFLIPYDISQKSAERQANSLKTLQYFEQLIKE